MTKTVFRMAVLMAVVLPMLAPAQESYSDPGTYVVESRYPAASYTPGYDLNDTMPWDTKILLFNRARNYTALEKNMVVNDEARLLRTMARIDPADGQQYVEQPQNTLEANRESVSPSIQFSPINSTTQTFTNSFERQEEFGNEYFGGAYYIGGFIKATAATATAAKKLEAYVDGNVSTKIFRVNKQIARGRASIAGQNGGSNNGTVALYAMGQQLWSAGLSGSFAPTPINWSRYFFKVSKTFMVGPVPVTVTASLSGGVRLAVTGQVGPTVARLIVNPGAYASVTATGSVNVVLVSFGVSSNLSLVNINLPVTSELSWPTCELTWRLKAEVEMNCLSGNVQAYASVQFVFFKKTWRLTIASWPGINRSRKLYDAAGTETLGTC